MSGVAPVSSYSYRPVRDYSGVEALPPVEPADPVFSATDRQARWANADSFEGDATSYALLGTQSASEQAAAHSELAGALAGRQRDIFEVFDQNMR